MAQFSNERDETFQQLVHIGVQLTKSRGHVSRNATDHMQGKSHSANDTLKFR